MPTNRFFSYRPSKYRSQFVPTKLPFEQMGKALQAEQQEYDTTLSGADQMEDQLQVEGPQIISQYTDLPRKRQVQKQQEYDQRINEVVEDLQQTGDTNRAVERMRKIRDDFKGDPVVNTLSQMRETEKKMQEDIRGLRESGDQPLRGDPFQRWAQSMQEEGEIRDMPYLGAEKTLDYSSSIKDYMGNIKDIVKQDEQLTMDPDAGPGKLGIVDKTNKRSGVGLRRFKNLARQKTSGWLSNSKEGRQFAKDLQMRGYGEEEIKDAAYNEFIRANSEQIGQDQIERYSRPDLGLDDGRGGSGDGGEGNVTITPKGSLQELTPEGEEFSVDNALSYANKLEAQGDERHANKIRSLINEKEEELKNMSVEELKAAGIDLPEGKSWAETTKEVKKYSDIIDPNVSASLAPTHALVSHDKAESLLQKEGLDPFYKTNEHGVSTDTGFDIAGKQSKDRAAAVLIKQGNSPSQAKKKVEDMTYGEAEEVVEGIRDKVEITSEYNKALNSYMSEQGIVTGRWAKPNSIPDGLQESMASMNVDRDFKDLKVVDDSGYDTEDIKNMKIKKNFVPSIARPNAFQEEGRMRFAVYNPDESEGKSSKNNPIIIEGTINRPRAFEAGRANTIYDNLIEQFDNERLERQFIESSKLGASPENPEGLNRVTTKRGMDIGYISADKGKAVPYAAGQSLTTIEAFQTADASGMGGAQKNIAEYVKRNANTDISQDKVIDVLRSISAGEDPKVSGVNKDTIDKISQLASSNTYTAENRGEATRLGLEFISLLDQNRGQ